MRARVRLDTAVGLVLALAAVGVGSQGASAQDVPAGPFPLAADVETLDGIIGAYYEVVSHPSGQPMQVERDRSLHHPDARAIITGVGPDGRPVIRNMTLAEYHEAADDASVAFFEWEIDRTTHRFGNVASVWSTYAHSDRPHGPVQGRGINSIQLYWDGSRWWITGWIFDSERPDNPIPQAYLPRGMP